MVHFVGAGPGAPDLITLRGAKLLAEADQVIYAGSLVNPALLENCRADCRILDSARMTLEEVVEAVRSAEAEGHTTVRLHTGDPSLYGAVREQMDRLDALGIPYDVTPGVSSFCAAAASLCAEYTLPGVSQTLILTRMAGRTPVPEPERAASLAAHGCSMVFFLSAGMLPELRRELLRGAYTDETPAALVYKASWEDEKLLKCTLGTLEACAREHAITKTALVLVGDFLAHGGERSRLYDPAFTTGYRKGIDT
ncbi:MAG: precorrin-4 C(11)-methyltransferase [Oscillospiraceae bacterium]|nr:precorrin-4 C(11)-methyltransferase [Oscillospiraceae bacterium]